MDIDAQLVEGESLSFEIDGGDEEEEEEEDEEGEDEHVLKDASICKVSLATIPMRMMIVSI